MSVLTKMIGYGAGLLSSPGLTVPEGVHPVGGFEVERYLGRWFEVARFDHYFEKGLSRVTADYSMRSDGGIDVLNQGYDARTGRWHTSRGIARFLDAPDVASLKVSFFRPIWGGYHVFSLDHDHYQWAMIAGATHSYLWILSREKSIKPEVMESLLAQARAAGFDTHDLMMVAQD